MFETSSVPWKTDSTPCCASPAARCITIPSSSSTSRMYPLSDAFTTTSGTVSAARRTPSGGCTSGGSHGTHGKNGGTTSRGAPWSTVGSRIGPTRGGSCTSCRATGPSRRPLGPSPGGNCGAHCPSGYHATRGGSRPPSTNTVRGRPAGSAAANTATTHRSSVRCSSGRRSGRRSGISHRISSRGSLSSSGCTRSATVRSRTGRRSCTGTPTSATRGTPASRSPSSTGGRWATGSSSRGAGALALSGREKYCGLGTPRPQQKREPGQSRAGAEKGQGSRKKSGHAGSAETRESFSPRTIALSARFEEPKRQSGRGRGGRHPTAADTVAHLPPEA